MTRRAITFWRLNAAMNRRGFLRSMVLAACAAATVGIAPAPPADPSIRLVTAFDVSVATLWATRFDVIHGFAVLSPSHMARLLLP